jgi:hypothetical protein
MTMAEPVLQVDNLATHFFTRDGVEDILNLQPLEDKAKAYQVRQVRGVALRCKLGVEE